MLRKTLPIAVLLVLSVRIASLAQAQSPIHEPYRLDPRIQTRSISFENPTGEPARGESSQQSGSRAKGGACPGDQAG